MVSKGATKIDLELLFWFKGRVITDINSAVLHLKPSRKKQQTFINPMKPLKGHSVLHCLGFNV